MLKDLEPAEPSEEDRKKTRSRAAAIATRFNDDERWRYHGRGINLETLQQEVLLPVEDLASDEQLHLLVTDYSELLRDYVKRQGLRVFIHSRGFF